MGEQKDHRESPAGNSQLSLYNTCPRKWAWKYVKGFKTTDKYEPLNLGSAIHEAQELFYLTGSLDEALTRGAEILGSLGWVEEDEPKVYDRMRESLRTWVDTYGQKDYDNKYVLETEQEYFLTLPSGYKMTVRVDALMEDEDGKYIRDTKTTGGQASQTMTAYMYNPQPVLYIAALRQNGKEVQGWKTDVIASRILKAGAKVDCLRSPLVMPTDKRIDDILQAYDDLVCSIKGSLEMVKEGAPLMEAFPMNPKSCYDFFRPCSFFNICHDIEEIEEPTHGFELDPWLKERKVLDTFENIC